MGSEREQEVLGRERKGGMKNRRAHGNVAGQNKLR